MMSVYSRNLFSFFLTEGVGVRRNRNEECWGSALFEGLTAGERAHEKLGPRPSRPNVGFLLSAVSSPHCLHAVPWAHVSTIKKRSPRQLKPAAAPAKTLLLDLDAHGWAPRSPGEHKVAHASASDKTML